MAMPAREKMRNWRLKHNATFESISRRCGVGHVLIAMVENGEVTHPNIAKKLQQFYKLTDLQTEELMPENRRPHSPKYDPDKYVDPKDLYREFQFSRNDKARRTGNSYTLLDSKLLMV